ncbi:EAL domain-containing protein [Lactobacillus sp. CBA3605]|uniref:EAL domain-containing protein n=1 Tax=Lactobacillus sp. CBA3605 TaxID=2099788 RepID=UPI000CFE23A2|nr:EAL domain-containing protein [Lactobacillus sp. CBA3605]AVK61965.1 EAL domain-containing protein [Lactobacillus sp. CBA3605]
MPTYKYFAQPIKNVLTNQTILYELLLRQWHEAQQTWGIPIDFELTPAAVIQLLDVAVKELKYHNVSINLTQKQFANPVMQRDLNAYVTENLLPRQLTIELVSTPDLAVLKAMSRDYRSAGVLIAFDDVGSDNLLADIAPMLPYANTIKFALQNSRQIGQANLKTAVSELRFWFEKAEAEQMLFTFEGIETAADLQLAHNLRITRGQGYLFAKPQLPVTFND